MSVPGAYVHFAVRPDDAVRAFQSLKKTSIEGVNVTLPLKEYAYAAADIVTDDARRVGVANCLYKRDGQLIAHNTDLEGFAAPLIKTLGPKVIAQSPAVIYGTGGASRAVISALLSMGCPEIRVCGRTDAKAEALCNEINVPNLYAVPWAQRHDAVNAAGLIINASAAGMKGRSALDVSLDKAPQSALVYDLIYIPLVTPLIAAAHARGLLTLGGLDMLIAQARPSFKLFFGKTPPDTLDPTKVLLKALGEA